MSKNIVFCADGTWSGDDEDPSDITNPTNVLKTYHNLCGIDVLETIPLADEQESIFTTVAGVQQVAKYIHGVGDSDNYLVKILGGTVGMGLVARIIRGYTFVSRNYLPGDRIFLIGFSRGAYTARALAGLISSLGLLNAQIYDLDNKELAYQMGAAAWRQFREQALAGDANKLGKLEDMLLLLPGFFAKPLQANALIADVPINTVAVWDTVGSMGIPEFSQYGEEMEVLRFVDSALSAQVAYGFQAIAVDEARGDFTPCVWDMPDPRVEQVLFPGAHSDIGGGYPIKPTECGLSDGTLKWMLERLASRGVLFATPQPTTPFPDALGTAHAPWGQIPWSALPQALRIDPNAQIPAGLLLSQSVLTRWQAVSVLPNPGADPERYRPLNLTSYLAPGGTVLDSGTIVPE